MRPLRLEMTAFGPYIDREVIDFSMLAGRNLFLIHGATGSGKTTLLDALTFALYGESSGAEREGRGMRCDLADPSCATEVTLDFAVGADTYRVSRSPEQERARRRGAGTCNQPGEATLLRLNGGRVQVLETGNRRVSAAVEQLLGFSPRQFRQVIVLPQGQFRGLLTAGSDEREKILQSLFSTEAFRRLQEDLKTREKELAGLVRRCLDEREFLLSGAHAESEEDLRTTMQALAQQVAESRAVVEGLEHAEAKARERLEQARAATLRLQELRSAEQALSDLEASEVEVGARRSELEAARRAGIVAPLLQAWQDAEAALAALSMELDGSASSARQAGERLAETEGRLTLERARDQEREALQRQVWQFEAHLVRARAIEHLHQQLTQADKAQVEAESAERAAREALDQTRQNMDDARNTCARLQEVLAGREAASLRLTEIDAIRGDRARLEEVGARLSQVQLLREGRSSEQQAAEAEWRSAADSLDLTLLHWREGQAGLLANALLEGAPCPVCGSTEHPAPAESSAVVSEVELEGAKERVGSWQARWQAASGETARLDREVAALEAQETGLKQALSAWLEASDEQVLKEQDDRRSTWAGTEEAAAELPRAQARLEQLRSECSDREGVLTLAEAAARKAVADARGARSEWAACCSELPEDLRDPAAVEARKAALAQQVEAMRAALSLAENQAEAARAEVAEAREKKASAERAVQESAAARERAAAALEKGLIEQGFADVDSARLSARSLQDMQHIQDELSSFEQALAAAQDRFSRARAAAAADEPPDLEALGAAAEGQAAELAQARDRLTNAGRDLEQVEQQLSALAEIEARRREREKAHGETARLAQVAAGDNELRVSFQRYVLGSMLDDVLISANERLLVMSQGRFSLERARQGADRRKAGGLDLEVSDAYSGTSRAVSSLSGGESFLAALALALGLADAVQAEAGGLRLETIFVDEGFGSLDPEALDAAVDALVDLQDSGRLVGIISHVQELRDRIEARLEVTCTRGGSHAAFRLG